MLWSKMAPPLPSEDCWVLSASSPSELVWHWLKENNKKREIMRNIFHNMFFQDFLISIQLERLNKKANGGRVDLFEETGFWASQ